VHKSAVPKAVDLRGCKANEIHWGVICIENIDELFENQ